MAAPESESTLKVIGFWSWLVKRDPEGDRGLDNVVNRWMLVHVLLAGGLAYFGKIEASELAKGLALPGAAILVGLAFGWAGRSAGLLQDKSFSKFLLEDGPSPEGYVYSFQLAVLAVLAFIGIALALVAGGLDVSSGNAALDAFTNRFLLLFFGSIAVRESWGIIYFVNKLTIQYYRVREVEVAKEAEAEAASKNG